MTIDLIPTDVMVEELKRRYPLLLLAGSVDVSKECLCELLVYHGDLCTLLGLTDILHDDLLDQHRALIELADDTP